MIDRLISLKIFVAENIKHARPNSRISFYDNVLAVVMLFYLKRFKFITANLISFSSFVFCAIGVLGYVFAGWQLTTIVLFFIAYTLDNLDGIWARYHRSTSVVGAWLDSSFDQLKNLIIYLGLFFGRRTDIEGEMILAVIILFCIFLILYSSNLQHIRTTEIKPDTAILKKRWIAFGPAEALILYSFIIILPGNMIIVPIALLISMLSVLIFILVKKIWAQKQC